MPCWVPKPPRLLGKSKSDKNVPLKPPTAVNKNALRTKPRTCWLALLRVPVAVPVPEKPHDRWRACVLCVCSGM